jgi:tripartite-type tricarboxylate transporter receptor subunit TctC
MLKTSRVRPAIGTGQATKASPDGNTLLVVSSSYVVNPSLFAKIPDDPYKDFDPVTLAVTSTTVLVVNPSVPAETVSDLVALIRANPGKYSYAHGGVGAATHLAGEQFRISLGLDLVPIPFNGGGPSVAAIVASHTPIGFCHITPVVPQIKDGNLRALAVTSKTRSQSALNVSTMTEAGYPNIQGDSWFGVLVPAGTRRDIFASFNHEIANPVLQPDMKERLATLGFEAVGSTPRSSPSKSSRCASSRHHLQLRLATAIYTENHARGGGEISRTAAIQGPILSAQLTRRRAKNQLLQQKLD